MQRYRLKIAYDGTHYSGWQVQPNAPSIQEEIEKALKILLKKEVRIIGAGRTDAGVHALGQVAHFNCEEELECLRYSLNGLLPRDIRIKEFEKVSPHFHAQQSATSKIYHYHLWLDPTDDPFTAPYHLQIFEKISLQDLVEASKLFIGKKDFASFTNAGSSAKSTVRTIFRIDIVEQRGGVRLEFEGDGFLYKMVRNITGTLLEVARGKRAFDSLAPLLEGKDRRRADLAAPAKGLFLNEVRYPQNFSQVVEVEKIPFDEW